MLLFFVLNCFVYNLLCFNSMKNKMIIELPWWPRNENFKVIERQVNGKFFVTCKLCP